MNQTFSMQSARSAGFIGAIAMAVLVETSVVHVLLSRVLPFAAWLFTLSSAWLLWWLYTDHRALASSTVRVSEDALAGEVGRRVVFATSRSNVKSVGRPPLLSVAGQPAGHVNATKPAAPNVLIVFREPVAARVLGLSRPIRQLALHLDAPQPFIDAMHPREPIPR